MKNRIQKLHEESTTLPANLPPRASRWLLAVFGAAVTPIAFITVVFLIGIFQSQGQYWWINSIMNIVIAVGFLSWFLVEALAFFGLATRRDWGLGMGYLTCLYWAFTGWGLIPAVAIAYYLHRAWEHNQTGVAADTPLWVEVIFLVGGLMVLAWGFFAYQVDQLVRSVFAAHDPPITANSADSIVLIMLYFGLPLFILQFAAFYGLARRRVWGREAAIVAALAQVLTIVGIPTGLLALRALWTRPAPAASPAPATAVA